MSVFEKGTTNHVGQHWTTIQTPTKTNETNAKQSGKQSNMESYKNQNKEIPKYPTPPYTKK